MKLKEFSKDARSHGRFSQYSALVFVASWGWGSGIAIDAAGTLSGKSRGLAARLSEMGLLKINAWDKSNHIKLYYTITKAGIEHAMENQDWARDFAFEYGYPFSPPPDKIPSFKSHSAVHDLYCQIICVMGIINIDEQGGRAKTYYSTPDLYGNFSAGEKIPDFIIERECCIDFFEFDNSKKSRPELLNFVDHYYRWSGRKVDGKKRRVAVWCINQQIKNQFMNIWRKGEMVGPFARSADGRWIQSSELGTRIEDYPESRGVYFHVLRGFGELQRELRECGKLGRQREDEYV